MPRPHRDVLERVRRYAAAVEAAHWAVLCKVARFSDGERLMSRFKTAIADFEAGRAPLGPVDETHNELCVAAAILRAQNVVELTTSRLCLDAHRRSISERR